jgi:PPOX class probable F420-dependent enzyme
MRARVAAAYSGHLATVRSDGTPHVVVFGYALKGDTLYSLVDQKPKRTQELQRLRNIRHQPRVAVLVDHYDVDDWSKLWWVRMDGTARILEQRSDERHRAMKALVGKYIQYRGQELRGPVIAIDVERWSGWES